MCSGVPPEWKEQITGFPERTLGNHQSHKAPQKPPLLKSRGTNKSPNLFQASAAWSRRDQQGENPGLEVLHSSRIFHPPGFQRGKREARWGRRLPGSSENLVGLDRRGLGSGYSRIRIKILSIFSKRGDKMMRTDCNSLL